jgi:hypothetical protein
VYCGGDPVNFIDPSGLAAQTVSYIIYDPHMYGEGTGRRFAEAMQRELEEKYGITVRLRAVSSTQEFTNTWNAMGGENTIIDTVVMLLHGSANSFIFRGKDDKDGNWRWGTNEDGSKARMTISDIESLGQQNMKLLVTLSCDPARTPAAGGRNVAEAFMYTQAGIQQMLASDNAVSNPLRKVSVTRGWWIFQTTTTHMVADIITWLSAG